MVIHTRRRSMLSALGLYLGAALLIGYFWVNAYSGNHGLNAKEELAREAAMLARELDALKAERAAWEQRVQLLRPKGLDPDMLDERARAQLGYVHPRDLILIIR
jgi:cell division protein FtsB